MVQRVTAKNRPVPSIFKTFEFLCRFPARSRSICGRIGVQMSYKRALKRGCPRSDRGRIRPWLFASFSLAMPFTAWYRFDTKKNSVNPYQAFAISNHGLKPRGYAKTIKAILRLRLMRAGWPRSDKRTTNNEPIQFSNTEPEKFRP